MASLPRPSLRLPLLGDVLKLDPVRPVQREMHMARELGPVFEIKILGDHLVIVAGAEPAAEVFDEARYAKAIVSPITKLRAIAQDGLFTAYNSEPNWAKAHNILAPGFTKPAMRRYHNTMLGCVGDLVEYWSEKVDGPAVDVSADMNKLTLEVIGRSGFGYSFESFTSGQDPFVAAMTRGLTYVSQAANDIPILREIFGRSATAQYGKDVELMHSTVDKIIANRRGSSESSDDLLQLMLDTSDPESGEQLSDANIRNQILTFLVAGHETTAGTLAFALHYLSVNPNLAAQARAEVDAVASTGEALSFEQIPKLRFIRRVIDETLRLWPSGPAFFRKPRADTDLLGKYPLKKGQPVLVLLLSLHRDPIWGENPEEFDPDRFLPAAIRERPGHVYKPFGTGARACIGRQFALHEAVLALATIVQRFQFAPVEDYELQVKELMTIRPEGLRLKLSSR